MHVRREQGVRHGFTGSPRVVCLGHLFIAKKRPPKTRVYFRRASKNAGNFLTPPKTEHHRIDLSAMRLALACSVMMRCASFTHECPLRTLRVNVSSRWLSPPETTSKYRTYAHKTHAHAHATLSKKYGASWTTFRGRTATHHWPVTVVLLLTEVPRHRCFSDRRS